MVRKFFPLDKNYLLEQAQLSLQDDLLSALVERVKKQYVRQQNPLGLNDSFSEKILSWHPSTLKTLHNFYQNVAAIYRYKYGDNQLEFLWDGQGHLDKYRQEWTSIFEEWTTAFCQRDLFVQAILDLTVFLPQNRHAEMAENRMNNFALQYFDLRIHKTRGLVAVRVA
ncbi:MAG: hypothetical protein K1X47_05015 [Cyclobacteriaceae bacterium]|nr:hypothetical protein [Cyclobacteriaceae bacterium]